MCKWHKSTTQKDRLAAQTRQEQKARVSDREQR